MEEDKLPFSKRKKVLFTGCHHCKSPMISYNQLYKSSLTGGKEVIAPHVFYSCTRDHCPYKVDYSSEPTRVDQEIVRFVRRFV